MADRISTSVDAASQAVLKELYSHMRQESPDSELDRDAFYPVSIGRAIQLAGWSVEEVYFTGYLLDTPDRAIGTCDPDAKTITIYTKVNGDDVPLARQRFTAAHELGHALLHQRVCAGAILRRTQSAVSSRSSFINPHETRLEAQADKFASLVLMPFDAVQFHFRRVYEMNYFNTSDPPTLEPLKVSLKDKLTLREMAVLLAKSPWYSKQAPLTEYFGVSASAMGRRLVELDLVRV